ncbi:VCBS repeat-containing protein [Flavihumibacter petaseus]|uniref:VCBS repeat-containing protein n=1 Tax=Flavihumibacter petaseus TaxID=549295 RepID=UPI00061D1BAE|nr:VCBS repeat-containing protein [Flavihumibacter petaseus]
MKRIALFALMGCLLISCRDKSSSNPLFNRVENSGIDFQNKIENTRDFNIFNYRNFYNGSGCAIGDINNDGLADVFFTANMGSNKLYLNKGNFAFQDITDKAGVADAENWSTGVVMVDINHDGWLDIFVCNAGYINGRVPVCKMYVNNRDNTFTDHAAIYGLDNKGGYTTHAAFFDYDLDGDLDCYILNNSFIPVNTLNYANKRDLRAKDWPVADFLKGGGDKLLRNDGGRFTDVSEAAHIYGSLIGFGLGVTVGDVNGDRYPDIYVSNDFFERDYLYINQRDGTFRDELENRVQHISHSSMGADMADINNDGREDIFVTEMLPDNETRLKTTTSFENIDIQRLKQKSGFYNQFMQNTLQVNNGNGQFMETAFYSGVAASDWSWGGLFFDADNDGLTDLYVCNGIFQDVTDQDFIDFFANDIIQKMVLTGKREEVDEVINNMPSRPIANKMFRNKGDVQFEDMASRWGLDEPSFSNGAAYGDLDNDGDLDLVVNNVNAKAFVYRNMQNRNDGNHTISVVLKGKGLNTFAVGSQVRIFQGGKVLSRELIPSRGFQSSVDYKIVIGTGKLPVDSMQVIWPDRSVDTWLHPAVDSTYHLTASAAAKPFVPDAGVPPVLFTRVAGAPFDKHQEDDYIDFYYERNLPVMLSREGPKITAADVNGDGLTDLFIGSAVNQPRMIYLQQANGFVKKEIPAFNLNRGIDDDAVLFFDADHDGDQDLFIGAGGNFITPQPSGLAHRLFLNDGKGNFEWKQNAFPANTENISVAIANDIDGDGDADLFVGGRNVPQQYGNAPNSYIYINDGKGNFSDQTASVSPELVQAGMITGAAWADINQDGRADLVITGEWMSPQVFLNQGGKLVRTKTSLDALQGWWGALVAADLDNDGKTDLVLGNSGKNFYLKPDEKHPIKLWIGDFDQNGQEEKILTRTIDGKDKPVFLKRELTDQIPSLKKQNLKHEQYALKSIQELFPEKVLSKATVRIFNYNASIVAWNDGKGNFSVSELPYPVQLSSVNAIAVKDINGDGKADMVMGGNNLHLQPQFCRLDASEGHLLFNQGNRQWQNNDPAFSGLQLKGEIRGLQFLEFQQRLSLLVTQNDSVPVLLSVQHAKSEKH